MNSMNALRKNNKRQKRRERNRTHYIVIIPQFYQTPGNYYVVGRTPYMEIRFDSLNKALKYAKKRNLLNRSSRIVIRKRNHPDKELPGELVI